MADPCGRETRAGTPCKAPRVTGKDACAGHLGLGIASDPATYSARGLETRKAQAKLRKKTLLELLNERLEAKAEAIAAAYDRAVDNDDMRSIEAWITRVHGRPIERVQEIPGLDVLEMSPAERQKLAAQVLAQLAPEDRDELAERRRNAA